jgi:ADP-heptose:LPS heptosyltransferase
MRNTRAVSPQAEELLAYCLRGEPWPADLLTTLTTDESSPALFRVVVEGLADRFEPALCQIYARLFSEALSYVDTKFDPAQLLARYERVRKPRRVASDPRKIFVLSRVTLGADVAISSVILDAAKRRFPAAEIFLVGSSKSWELFAADSRIQHLPVSYSRSGSLRERVAPYAGLKTQLSQPDSIVIDTDSRLTQLGLLPVCPEENYYFFESRSYGAEGNESLSTLTHRWVSETFGIEDASAYIAPAAAPRIDRHPLAAISFGVGDNPAKRIADPFEQQLLRNLVDCGFFVCIDEGAGEEEAERVRRAIAGLPTHLVQSCRGSFAQFAGIIAQSDLYVGYDSAGQHVAAACGTPLISIFAGFPCERMFHRWRPYGHAVIEIIRAENPDPERVLEATFAAIPRAVGARPNIA